MKTKRARDVRRRAGALRAPVAALLALFANLLAAAAATAEPALWRVEGPAGTAYLFGTVHLLKPGTNWRSPRMDAAFARSDALWLEIADAGDPAGMAALMERYGRDPARGLYGRLSPADQTRLRADLARAGLGADAFGSLRPWRAALTLDVLRLQVDGYDPSAGVETVLRAAARDRGARIEGFETAEQQIRYLADAPEGVGLQLLRSALDDADKPDALGEEVAAWLRGDEAALARILAEDLRRDFPAAYKILVLERNQRFAARVAAMVRRPGTAFVAVGALHLVGPDSVEADLRRLGLRVRRL